MEIVSFELAQKLKEKGFREKTFGFYLLLIKLPQYPLTYITKNYNKEDDFYSAPTISQVLKWLRGKNIHLYTDIDNEGWYFEIKCLKTRFMVNTDFFERYNTYEQATLAGIKYTLDNLI